VRALLAALLAIALSLLAVAYGSASAPVTKTEIVYWSPLDATGTVKKILRMEFVRGGRCDIGYTYVGEIAYRCDAGEYLYNACWREGPNPTEFVICTGTPWQKMVTRLRSKHLLLYPGVTYEPAATYPWAIELTDGNRCVVLQGAHSSVPDRGRSYTIDYLCRPGPLVLMREGIRRGRVWQAVAGRYDHSKKRYVIVGNRAVRRVYFGKLPPPLTRQHKLAGEAVRAAMRAVWGRVSDEARVAAVRLALPEADWAYVIFSQGRSAVLRRSNGVWRDASAYKPYCKKLPERVRKQLFLGKRTWNPVPDRFMAPRAPRGEQRC
jgi:hypothetical protein